MFIQNYCGGRENVTSKDLDFVDRVFANTLINTCHINLPETRLFEQMNREDYTAYVKDTLLALACQAATDALSKAGFSSGQVTHLVFGTMTATIRAPSLDICIIRRLHLNATVKRLNVEAMGCLTGFRLMGLCRDIAAHDENNVVLLVVCDIRSALGNQLTPFTPMQPIDRSNAIISAMFRDAGGAAIISNKQQKTSDLCIVDHCSMLVPDTFDHVILQEFNNGSIHLFLDKALPDALCTQVAPFINQLLTSYGIDITRCLFALHTGGPKIIKGIQCCLKLEPKQFFGTWYVMKNYGNLSGSSNLVVLDHIIRHQELKAMDNLNNIVFPSDFSTYTHIVGLSFGPGLGVECVLFQM